MLTNSQQSWQELTRVVTNHSRMMGVEWSCIDSTLQPCDSLITVYWVIDSQWLIRLWNIAEYTFCGQLFYLFLKRGYKWFQFPARQMWWMLPKLLFPHSLPRPAAQAKGKQCVFAATRGSNKFPPGVAGKQVWVHTWRDVSFGPAGMGQKDFIIWLFSSS